MIKKCIGCGLILQDTNKENGGYTPNMKNDYCMRCFRLKNYGEKKEGEVIDEAKIIAKVNKSKGIAFFLIDFLNINKYTLEIFKKVNIPKALIISKSDTLRKEQKFNKIEQWLKDVYHLNEDILFISKKNDFKNVNIFKYMDKMSTNTCYIMGITNAGKSTFINSILKQAKIKKEIVTSNKPNTTLDFIKVRVDDYVIYDTPGFAYLNLNDKIVTSTIKPLTYQITKPTTIIINNTWEFYFAHPNRITIYMTHNNVKRVYKNVIKDAHQVKVLANHDIIIPGVGFINVKESCQVLSNLEITETRLNVSGVEL